MISVRVGLYAAVLSAALAQGSQGPAGPGQAIREWGGGEWAQFGRNVAASTPNFASLSAAQKARRVFEQYCDLLDRNGSPLDKSWASRVPETAQNPSTLVSDAKSWRCGGHRDKLSRAMQAAFKASGKTPTEVLLGALKPEAGISDLNRNHTALAVMCDGELLVFDPWFHATVFGRRYASPRPSPMNGMSVGAWEAFLRTHGYSRFSAAEEGFYPDIATAIAKDLPYLPFTMNPAETVKRHRAAFQKHPGGNWVLTRMDLTSVPANATVAPGSFVIVSPYQFVQPASGAAVYTRLMVVGALAGSQGLAYLKPDAAAKFTLTLTASFLGPSDPNPPAPGYPLCRTTVAASPVGIIEFGDGSARNKATFGPRPDEDLVDALVRPGSLSLRGGFAVPRGKRGDTMTIGWFIGGLVGGGGVVYHYRYE